MIKIPSYTTAIFCGAVIMPLYIIGWNYLEEKHFAQIIIILWSFIGFAFPLFFATADIQYLRKTGGIFKFRASYEDFKLFYIPTWKRMLVWFIATIFSVIILQQMGIKI